MSRKRKIQLKIYDPDAICSTLEQMGIKFAQGEVFWTGYHTSEQVDFVIPNGSSNLNGLGGIGFKQAEDGGLYIVVDDKDERKSAYASILAQFRKEYSTQAWVNFLTRKGYRVEVDDEGQIHAHSTLKSSGKLMQQQQAEKRTVTVGGGW